MNSCHSLIFFICFAVSVLASYGETGDPSADSKYMEHFISVNTTAEKLEILRDIQKNVLFSNLVPTNTLASLDGSDYQKAVNETNKAKDFIKLLSVIAKDIQSGQYTSEELVDLCNLLKDLRTNVLRENQIGSVNIEIMNMVYLLRCGITYKLLSREDFVDYYELGYFEKYDYSSQSVIQIYRNESNISLEGNMTDVQSIIKDATSMKYPYFVRNYKLQKGIEGDLTLRDIEKMHLYKLMEENGDVVHPFDSFNGLAFAASYVNVKKNVLLTMMAIRYKITQLEEMEPYQVKLRFEQDIRYTVDYDDVQLFGNYSSSQDKEFLREFIFQIKENIATQGDHLLGLVHHRCAMVEKEA